MEHTIAQARTFDVPERVPFRLTQNIIDGMGVTGVEGRTTHSFATGTPSVRAADLATFMTRCLPTILRDHSENLARQQGESDVSP